MKQLIEKLNKCRNSYYNDAISIVSDAEYDKLFDQLVQMEKDTGIIFPNSPTQTVGYEVKSELEKVTHNHPMLSLDKTKSVDDLRDFMGDKECVLSLKLDGLTISLTYENGELVAAETRGDGTVGSDVLHNVKQFINVPTTIPYKDRYVIDGEAIITHDDFELINENLADADKYKNPRNLVAGTVNTLDSAVVAKRNVRFVAWRIVEATDLSYSLLECEKFGFSMVPFIYFNKDADINEMIDQAKRFAEILHYPIDGLVLAYNNMEYGESLGSTSHHPRHSIAFKFQEDIETTTLREIEWSLGGTGAICPVAIFDPVELCGTTVSRASMHNLSIMKSLNVKIGSII